jgi:hypothetical protein
MRQMSTPSRALAVAVVLLAPRLVAGQQPQTDTSKTRALPGAIDLSLSDSAQRRIAQAMAKDLGDLRKAEASYYSAHHVYTYSMGDLAPFRPSAGNVIAITPTDGGGYHAVATNPALPGAEAGFDVPAPKQ